AFERARDERAKLTPPEEVGARASVKARQRAEELGIDLASLGLSRLLTVHDDEAAAAAATPGDLSRLPAPLPGEPNRQRVLLIGGARGATQVIDIFRGGDTQTAVAIVDDSRDKWGQDVYGVPIVGGSDRLGALWAEGAFDAAI